MPTIQIDNLGSPGIIKDIPAHELPVNAWSDGKNVRFRDNAVEKITGHEEVYTGAPVAPFWLMPWVTATDYHWFYANAAKIYSVTGSTHTDRTRTSGGDYTAGTYPHWNGGVLGGVPIMNNDGGADPPQSWDGSDMQNLPNWPFAGTPAVGDPKWHAKVVRPFREFLVALYTKEDEGSGADVFSTRVRWSDPADPGTVPTDWLPTASNLAGSIPLSGTTDPLVDCLPLRNVNMIYKEESTHTMQFVGGQQVFAFREAFSSFGMLSDNCVRSFFGKHLVMSKGDVVLHNGQTADSVITNKMRRHLFDSLDGDNFANSFIQAHPERSEMWLCVPTEGQVYCNRAYIWHWRDNNWSIRDLPSIAFIGAGTVDRSGESQVINDLGEIIDSYTNTFDYRLYNPAKTELMMAKPAPPQLLHVDKTNTFDGAPFYGMIERTGLAVAPAHNGGVTVDTQSVKFARRVYPKILADPGVTVSVEVGAQQYIDGPVVWGDSQEFDPATQRHVDIRVNGRALAIRFSSNGVGQWKLTSYGLDMDVIGGS